MGVDHTLEELMSQLGKQENQFSLAMSLMKITRLFPNSDCFKI